MSLKELAISFICYKFYVEVLRVLFICFAEKAAGCQA